MHYISYHSDSNSKLKCTCSYSQQTHDLQHPLIKKLALVSILNQQTPIHAEPKLPSLPETKSLYSGQTIMHWLFIVWQFPLLLNHNNVVVLYTGYMVYTEIHKLCVVSTLSPC